MTAEAAETAKPEETGKRERSTIEFPYMALEDAIAVARAIHETTGSSPSQHEQLAAKLKLSPNSSGYRVRLSAARLFGVIESDRSGGVKLTELGQLIVDAAREREAKVRAFLSVPLFKKVYEHNRGKMLPPAPALEREMVAFGVAQKQAERARQVFQRSAEVAGFFEMDRTRLIVPPGVGETPPSPDKGEQKPDTKTGGNGGGGDELPPGTDPIIAGLLKRLPKSGEVWPRAQRKLWLQLLEGSFDLIYQADDEAAH